MHIEPTKKRRHRIRDLVLYLAISLAVAGTFVALALLGMSRDKFLKLDFFFFYTLGAFGFFVERSKALLRKPLFWTFLTCSFLLHCGISWLIFARVKHVNSDWIAAGVLEAAFLVAAAKRLFRPTPSPQ